MGKLQAACAFQPSPAAAELPLIPRAQHPHSKKCPSLPTSGIISALCRPAVPKTCHPLAGLMGKEILIFTRDWEAVCYDAKNTELGVGIFYSSSCPVSTLCENFSFWFSELYLCEGGGVVLSYLQSPFQINPGILNCIKSYKIRGIKTQLPIGKSQGTWPRGT